MDGAGLGIIAEGPPPGDFAVEGFLAEAQTGGLGRAGAIVFDGGKAGETVEGFLVGSG